MNMLVGLIFLLVVIPFAEVHSQWDTPLPTPKVEGSVTAITVPPDDLEFSVNDVPLLRVSSLEFTDGLMTSGATAMILVTMGSTAPTMLMYEANKIHHFKLAFADTVYEFDGVVTRAAFNLVDDVVMEVTMLIEAIETLKRYPRVA